MVAGLSITIPAAACGSAYTQEDVERSRREQRLASALHEEGNIPGALSSVDRALSIYPDNAEAHVLRGFLYSERGDFGQAERSLVRAIRLLEQRPESATALAEAKNMLGVVRVNQRRYDEAIALFRESAADIHNAAPFHAWGNLGRAYMEKHDYASAHEALATATRLQPRFCVGHFLIGKVYFAQDDFAHAEQAFTSALEADARCVTFQDAWRLRGETRARLEHREDALADFQRCVELGPQNETGRTCQRYLEN